MVTGERTGMLHHITAGPHHLLADEPEDHGGGDVGPNPYELLLASLGACTGMTLRMYADRKQWPLERVRVRLSHEKIHAEDCRDCETKEGKVDRIKRLLVLEGDLSDQQRQRLVEIADRCPVSRTLTSETLIDTRLD
jgi:putative redox protein